MDYMLKEKEGKSKINIAILLTHTFDYMQTPFFDSMLALNTKYPYSIYRSNKLPIEQNRTELAELALSKGATHLLFLDTDIIPRDNNFLDIMISYDMPIVGLLCFKKIAPFEPIIYKTAAPKEEKLNDSWVKYPKGLVECDATGTGCLLVKKEVFATMEKPYFKFYANYREGLYQSEDIYFLNNALNNGYKIMVDTEHTCLHFGLAGYGEENFKNERDRLALKKLDTIKSEA